MHISSLNVMFCANVSLCLPVAQNVPATDNCSYFTVRVLLMCT